MIAGKNFQERRMRVSDLLCSIVNGHVMSITNEVGSRIRGRV